MMKNINEIKATEAIQLMDEWDTDTRIRKGRKANLISFHMRDDDQLSILEREPGWMDGTIAGEDVTMLYAISDELVYADMAPFMSTIISIGEYKNRQEDGVHPYRLSRFEDDKSTAVFKRAADGSEAKAIIVGRATNAQWHLPLLDGISKITKDAGGLSIWTHVNQFGLLSLRVSNDAAVRMMDISFLRTVDGHHLIINQNGKSHKSGRIMYDYDEDKGTAEACDAMLDDVRSIVGLLATTHWVA